MIAKPHSRRTAARARRTALLGCAVLVTAACGLQQSGLDGSVAVGQLGVAAGQPGQVGTAGMPMVDPATGELLPGASGSNGTSSSTGATGTTGSVSGGTVQGGTSGGSGSSGSSSSGSAGTGSLPQTPGLQGELVVSYVNVTGFDQLGKVVVVKTASTGDAGAQTKALESWVNAHGGIAGRKLKTVVHDYNAQQASEVNDNNLCAAIAGTDKAFMAVLHGQIHSSARDCYQAKKVLAFEGAAYGFGHDFYTSHSPYLWSPSYPDYDQSSKALVQTIKAKNWLKGETKVGIVLWDDAPYHSVADKVLAPLLKGLGVEVVQASISNADIGSIENGIHAAAQTMIVNGVDHITFLGSAPLQPFFVQQNQQNNQFVYALSSFDVPRYMAVNFPRNMAGAIGVGYSPPDDVLDDQHPFPQPGMEAFCKKLYEDAGVSVPARYGVDVYNAKQSMSYCESTMLLKKVADQLGSNLSVAAWSATAERLGTSFQAAQTFSTSYGPSKHTGAAVYREITYDPGCTCMKYTSGNKAFS